MGSNFPIDKAWSYIVSVRDDRKTIFRNGLSIAWGKSNQQFTPIHFDCGKNPWSIAIGWGSLLVLSRSKMKYNEMKFCWEQWCLAECNWNQFQASPMQSSAAVWQFGLERSARGPTVIGWFIRWIEGQAWGKCKRLIVSLEHDDCELLEIHLQSDRLAS